MSHTPMTLAQKLMPNGIPRYIRCYDNRSRSTDRYTVCFTGRYGHKTAGEFYYLAMNASPFHPQGFGQHSSSKAPIDKPTYSHLGKRIAFRDLPEDCRKPVLSDYKNLWDLE